MIDTCVCCGTYVPEGRMICPGCEKFGGPKIVVNKKDAILEYLKKYHCGRRNAVHSLENKFVSHITSFYIVNIMPLTSANLQIHIIINLNKL